MKLYILSPPKSATPGHVPPFFPPLCTGSYFNSAETSKIIRLLMLSPLAEIINYDHSLLQMIIQI